MMKGGPMDNRLFIKRISFQTPIVISLLISFFGLYFGSLLGRVWIIFASLMLGIAVCIWGHLLHLESRKDFKTDDFLTSALLIGAFGVMTVSLGTSAIRALVSRSGLVSAAVLALTALIFLALFVFELFYVKPMTKPEWSKKKLIALLPVAVAALTVAILSLENFGAWIRWDSYDYYYYFDNLSYTSLNVFDNLRPANHAAYGGSLIFMVINGIVGNTKAALMLINILMLVVETLLFNRIITKLFPHWHRICQILATCIYAFSPFVFGLAWSVNLEAFLIFGFVLFFWGEVEKLPLVQTFAALLICFSKETGAVILAMIILARLICNFIVKSKREKSFLEKLELKLTAPILAVGILWIYDFLSNSWMSSNNLTIEMVQENSVFNGFGYNPTFIVDRIVSIVFTNFTWLVLLVILAGFVVGAIRKRGSDSEERTYMLVELLVAAAASAIPLLLFITYNHIRYAAPTVILLVLLLPEALDRMLADCRVRSALCAALAALSLAQCYVTADPMMYLFCDTLDKGNGKIAIADNNILVKVSTSNTISIDAQYNREILYFDKVFDDILSEIGYDDNTCILLSGEYVKPSIGQYVGTEYLIMGFGYPYMEKARFICWDDSKGARYLGTNADDAMNIIYVSQHSDIYEALESYDRCIFISFSFSNTNLFNHFMSPFKHEKIAQKTLNGWIVSAELVTDKVS